MALNNLVVDAINKTIREHTQDCLLVIDVPTAQALKWSFKGGVSSLFASGSIQILILERGNESIDSLRVHVPQSVVFLLSAHIARYAPSIRNIVSSRAFTSCVVLSAWMESLHKAELTLDPDLMTEFDAYLNLEEFGDYFSLVAAKIRNWMLQAAETCEMDSDEMDDIECFVEYCPVSYASITSELFLLPASASVLPPLDPQIHHGLSKSLELPSSFDKQTRQLAFSLCSLLELLSVKEEIFAAGDFSKQLARCIISQSMEAPRRRVGSQMESNACVVLIDRTLDLATPTSHSENLFDIILETLPCNTDSFDREINSNLFFTNSVASSPITLAHGSDSDATDLLQVLINLPRRRDSMIAIRKRLVDLVSAYSSMTPPKVLGKPRVEQLLELMRAGICRDEKAADGILDSKAGPLAKVVAASVDALSAIQGTNFDNLQNVEQLICLSLSESLSPSSAFPPIMDILENVGNPQRPLCTLQSALRLAVYSFSTLGVASLLDEDMLYLLQSAFRAAFERSGSNRHSNNPEAAEMWAAHVLEQLSLIAKARGTLKQQTLIDANAIPPNSSFLHRVLSSALSVDTLSSSPTPNSVNLSTRTEKEDLSHIPYGGTLGTVLSGFSRLLGTKRPKISDYRTVIVFIVGGVTASEVADVKALLSAASSPGPGEVNVLVGSTAMVSGGKSILESIFPKFS